MESQLFANWRLLADFVRRELRSRFAGSSLGIYWSVIHPLIILALYILVFSTLVRGGRFEVRGHIASYAIFLCPAIIAWNWLNESISGACSAVTNNGALIKKVVFPSAILPAASIAGALVPFLVSMTVFLVFVALSGAFHPATLLYLPVVMALQLAMIAGPAYFLATLNVFVRDTMPVVMAAFQVLFWATPIIYTEETLTAPYPWMSYWFEINPVTHLMRCYREAIIAHQPPPLASAVYILIFSVLAYHAGRTAFLRSRAHFADEV